MHVGRASRQPGSQSFRSPSYSGRCYRRFSALLERQRKQISRLEHENERLQRMAKGLSRRVFERRIKDPARTLADLRSALRDAGLIGIQMKRSGSSASGLTLRPG